jgi:hypothetical protein
MSKASPASLQIFIDMPICVLEDRVQYSTVHILNVFCDGHLQLINCVLYCNNQVHRDFLITLYIGGTGCLDYSGFVIFLGYPEDGGSISSLKRN